MKERPILFNAPMVRAIIDGSKTQTRRIMKPQPTLEGTWVQAAIRGGTASYGSEQGFRESHPGWCPHGWEGDRLWVRETHAIVPRTAYAHSDGVDQVLRYDDNHDAAIFRADWTLSRGGIKWRPSIHMPRWASRIQLEITGIRVERLQDISQEDAIAEGAPRSHPSIDKVSREFGYEDFSRSWYGQLWESINGAGSWDANPWVWVIEFRRIKP